MYVIITKNMNLLLYLVENNASRFEEVDKKLRRDLKSEAMISTPNRNVALLALFDGAKVYEPYTLSPLIPECDTKEELTDKLVDILFETLGIRKPMNGYEYLKYMIKCHVEDDSYCMNPMGTVVYPECAKAFGVSPTTVSKNANLALKLSYARNSKKYVAIYSRNGEPNPENEPKAAGFVVIMAERIRALLPKD